MSLVPNFLRGPYAFALRSRDGRGTTPNLAGLLPPPAKPQLPARAMDVAPDQAVGQPEAKTVLEMLNHAAEALDYLQTRCRELETDAEDAAARANRTLAEARRGAAAWEQRALASEAQVEDLETRLAAADQTAMELRARLICLYGKLTASVDTVRFQTLARALAEQDDAPVLDLAHQPKRVVAA